MVTLEVRNLRTSFFTKAGEVKAVDDVSFTVDRGQVLGLVGESGSGKTVTGFSIMGLGDAARSSFRVRIWWAFPSSVGRNCAGIRSPWFFKIR